MPRDLPLNEVRRLMLKKAEGSGLSATTAKHLQFSPITATQARSLSIPAFAGFKIPYFDLAGNPTKFFRVRYVEDTRSGFDKQTGEKGLRYIQPSNTVNEIYLPPIAPWKKIAADAQIPLLITEGELKAACATNAGVPTIGLGGVWSFKSGKNGLRHLAVFKEFDWEKRPVYIAYDSDAASNQKVRKAEIALCEELERLGASPHIVRLPGDEGQKVGLDDYILANGAEPLRELIATAESFAGARELHEFNQEVLYVRDPGLIWRLDNQQRIAVNAFTSHAYSNRIILRPVPGSKADKFEEVPLPTAWLQWPGRAEVERLTYAPGKELFLSETNELNIWKGWGVTPKSGDVSPWKELLDYMFEGDHAARNWFEDWAAYPLQYPGTKLYTATVIWGPVHGTGKSLIGYTLGAIYGTNFTEIDDEKLYAPHNEWAENKQFVLGEEITGGDKRLVADRIKGMITRRSIRLNPKYIPSYSIPDCLNYYFTSNHPDAFFLEDTDRRFFIHQTPRAPQSTAFYARYDKWLNGDGPAALFAYLLQRDISKFNPKSPAPMTEAKAAMIDGNRSELGSWVARIFSEPEQVLRMGDVALEGDIWTPAELLALYDPLGVKKVSANAMGRELSRQNAVRVPGAIAALPNGSHARLLAIRNLDKWKKARHADWLDHYCKTRQPEKPKQSAARKF